MNEIVYTALAVALGLASVAAMWAIINGILERAWKFAFGAFCFAVFFAFGSLDMYECSQGRCVAEDPSVPRLR